MGHQKFKNLKIGVDLDGVIGDLSEPIQLMVQQKLSLDITKIVKSKKIVEYHLENWPEIKAIPGGQDFVIQLFNRPKIYQVAKPIDGALNFLEKWQALGHRLWVITARPPHLKKTTFSWLIKNGYGWLVEEKRVVFNYPGSGFCPRHKPELVRELEIQIFIEDNLETLEKTTAGSIIQKVLFEKPWNLNREVDSKTTVAKTWLEIDRVVQKFAFLS